MANLFDSIREFFAQKEALPPGSYSYTAPADDPLNYRLHLRIDTDGSGVLIVNAATILHLNMSAAEYAYHLIQGTPADEVARQVASRYQVKYDTALQDYEDFKERIEALITTPDLDPVSFLNFERHIPYSNELTAPYRLDCALTYRLPEGVDALDAPTKRVDRELTTEEWKQIIDKAWAVGIPQILFTGGEPTLRDDLPELLQHAEDNGQVTGILTDGLKLADTNYLNALLQAGLDHAMIVMQPNQEQTWEALSSFSYWTETLDEDIYVAAHLTITTENAADITAHLARLAKAGVSAVSLSTNSPELIGKLTEARDYVSHLDLGLVWDLPVPYSKMNPVDLELEGELALGGEMALQHEMGLEVAPKSEDYRSGAGRGWLYVEPDGDVLPGQGINTILGNLLTDSWEDIWAKAKEYKG